MLGAIIGDIIGSVHEFSKDKIRDAELFVDSSIFTDDSVLTLATASAVMEDSDYGERYGRFFTLYYNRQHSDYMGPGIGYGPMFCEWGLTPINSRKPYNSYGNGSAMRVSPIAWKYNSLVDVMIEAQLSASCTHNHIEGIKGAQSVAVAILMGRQGFPKEEIKKLIETYFGYNLDFDLDNLHREYTFNATAHGSVPQAIFCALNANSFEEVMRNCLYIGGDTDTIGAIAGSIAEPLYGIPVEFRDKAMKILEDHAPNLMGIALEFEKRYGKGKVIKKETKINRFFSLTKFFMK
jgi:ADP-ribosyl-[dinitrogen reductase] hydrolase